MGGWVGGYLQCPEEGDEEEEVVHTGNAAIFLLVRGRGGGGGIGLLLEVVEEELDDWVWVGGCVGGWVVDLPGSSG